MEYTEEEILEVVQRWENSYSGERRIGLSIT